MTDLLWSDVYQNQGLGYGGMVGVKGVGRVWQTDQLLHG